MTLSRKQKGEKVGGGFFVFCRGRTSGRIKINADTVKAGYWLPFEHPDFIAARTEADKLQKKHPDKIFCVLGQCYQTTPPVPPAAKPGDF